MPAAKFTRATPVTCVTCGCLFTPVAYRPDRNKIQHSPGRNTCSKKCYLQRLSAANTKDMIPRFWSLVDRRSDDECWPWMGGRYPLGYGQFGRSDGGTRIASRCAYEFTHGQVPLDLEVRHKCDNPCCCNPNHLETGTHKDNMNDRVVRGQSRLSQATKDKISLAAKGKRLTAEHREKLSAAKLGKPSKKRKPVVINGVNYASTGEAIKILKCASKTIRKMISSGAAQYV